MSPEHGATLLYVGGGESRKVSAVHEAFRSRGLEQTVAEGSENLGILGTLNVADACRANGIPGVTDACDAGAQVTCGTGGSVGVAGVSRGMSSTSGILAVAAKHEGIST